MRIVFFIFITFICTADYEFEMSVIILVIILELGTANLHSYILGNISSENFHKNNTIRKQKYTHHMQKRNISNLNT